MSSPFFQLLAHIFVSTHTAEHDASTQGALQGIGFGKSQIDAGTTLVEKGLALVEEKRETAADNRILEHNIHIAVSELEMWLQTAEFRLKKAAVPPELLDAAYAKDLHASSHTLSAIGHALRMGGLLRTEKAIQDKLGDLRQTRDLIMRGSTLLKKLYKATTLFLNPGAMNAPDLPVFAEIAAHREAMQSWMIDFDRAARKLFETPGLLGRLGYLPEGIGLPAGGTAYGVPLHQRAQREAPDPGDARPTSGWAVGRQGNRENLGEGWLDAPHLEVTDADTSPQAPSTKDTPSA